LLTGLDDVGRSCVVDEVRLSTVPAHEVLFHGEGVPPELPAAGPSPYLDLGVSPGVLRWSILSFEPGRSFDLHETDTVDLDLVLAGSIELILDTGTYALGVGDGAVINGVGHGWRVGPDGCVFSVANLGGQARRRAAT
jgi:hypothetical protein